MDELGAWLKSNGLDDYLQSFIDHDVRFADLAHLTEDDVRELGLPLGARRRMLTALRTLASEPSARASSPPDERSAEAGAQHRPLTVFFADLVDSTRLARQLDVEDFRDINRSYQDVARVAIERFDGYVARYMGDGVLAYFGYPVAHEDDPERAVRAGMQLVKAVAALDVGPALSARVGIATGSVLVGDAIGEGASREHAAVGEIPNLAARLQGVATPGTVVVDDSTQRATGRAFRCHRLPSTPLRGFDVPVQAWRIDGERNVASRFEARGRVQSSLVGRDHEVGFLSERWRAARGGEGQLVLLSGEPGIGKSRLAEELDRRIPGKDRHVTLRYQCSPFHVTTPFHPVVQHLRRAADLSDSDAPAEKLRKLEAMVECWPSGSATAVMLLAALLSVPFEDAYGDLELTPESRRQKTVDVLVTRLLEVSAEGPVLFLLEDAHWLDPSTHDLLGQIASNVLSAPVMVVITHRPEWVPGFGEQPHLVSLSLSRLVSGQSVELAGAIAGNVLPDTTLRQIIERAGGVPLFIEELTRALVEAGPEAAARQVPVTLQASLAARIDRLGAGKRVIQAAAVIGREFEPWMLAAVTRTPEAELAAPLDAAAGSGLVYLAKAAPRPVYAFKHALLQDVVYDSLLREERRAFHLRLAEALRGDRDPSDAGAAAVLAHHYRAAGLHDRAADCWLIAARGAVQRGAYDEVVAQARDALADLDAAAAGRGALSSRSEANRLIGEALMPRHGFGATEVRSHLFEAVELARQAEDDGAEVMALAGLGPAILSVEGPNECRAVAERMLTIARGRDDAVAVLRAVYRIGVCDLLIGDLRAGEERIAEAWRMMQTIGFSSSMRTVGTDLRVPMHTYLSFAKVLQCDPEQARQHVDQARMVAERENHAFTIAWAMTGDGRVRAHQGMLLEAIDVLDGALELCVRHGFDQRRGQALCLRGLAKARAGSKDEGLADLEEGLAYWQPRGPTFQSTELLMYLAEVQVACERYEAALARLAEADELGKRTGEQFFEAERLRLRARCAAAASDSTEALTLLDQALTVAERQGATIFRLRAAVDLARHRARLGHRTEAARVLARSLAACPYGAGLPEHGSATALLRELESPNH
jgi:class 3 adenylate cyclase/tetratricopeptide (TPR) repeat protein